MKLYYNPQLKEKAKELRKNATFAERFLWKYLRGQQLCNYQFMRQKPIDNYIVDFFCSKLGLIIEIDGISHNGKQKYDSIREKKLRKIGLEVIRFDGFYVINQIDDTLKIISDKISEIERKQPPNPLY